MVVRGKTGFPPCLNPKLHRLKKWQESAGAAMPTQQGAGLIYPRRLDNKDSDKITLPYDCKEQMYDNLDCQ